MKKLLLITILTVFISCSEEESGDTQCYQTSLASDIMPIINANCAINTCHANANSPLLTSPELVIEHADRINVRTSNGTMPPGGHSPLTAQEIDLIACWVNAGAQNN